jgi:rSAM/selenodomain-associated transferase 2
MVTCPSTLLPELSVVVPILDEGRNLLSLFATLERQEGVAFELILCDGGSQDGSREFLKDFLETLPFACRLLVSAPGRAIQLNMGAAHSRADMLLFLHVDSSFENRYALARGIASLKSAHRQAGHHNIAGHFPLHFIRRSAVRSWSFYYYAWKTRIHRAYCVHGDQGFMLSRDFFERVGPFDESLPFLEDVRLAEKIQKFGQWLLLPEVLGTSARRFETEGLYSRQALNAIVLACEDAGYGDWLVALPGIYRQQSTCGRLRLGPFLGEVSRRIRLLQWKERLILWRKVGAFVWNNAWQLALMLDTARHYRKGVPIGQGRLVILGWFDRFAPHIWPPAGYWLGATAAWIWYRWRLFVGSWS